MNPKADPLVAGAGAGVAKVAKSAWKVLDEEGGGGGGAGAGAKASKSA